MTEGIRERHSRACRSLSGGRCDCAPSYEAQLWDNAERQKVRKTFSSRAAAEKWRRDAKIALRRGRAAPGASKATLRQATDEWLDLVRRGVVRNRSGDKYKPSAIRGYDDTLRLRVLPELGDEPISDLRRPDLQELVDEMVGGGLAPATVQSTIIPVKALFRWLLARERIDHNPTVGLELPSVRSGRDRVVSREEVGQLLEALPEAERALWGTAFYCGLRRGELMALPVRLIDLEERVVHVNYGWDLREGRIETKGRNRRRVPIPKELHALLAAHLLATGRRDDDLAFGQAATVPFRPKAAQATADDAWKAAKLTRVTFHDCRHAFASLAIAAGVNAKALQTYMGHASIETTFDLYGHLMPGNEEEAAGLLDAYLAGSARGG